MSSKVELTQDSKSVLTLPTGAWQRLFFQLMNQFDKGQLQLITPDGNSYLFGEDSVTPVHNIPSLRICDDRFFRRALFGGSVGFGEAFVDGWWQTDDLVSVLGFFANNLKALDRIERRFGWMTRTVNLCRHWLNRNSLKQSKNNILAHYDLGNELYTNFLDESMCYSAGIYAGGDDSLAQAQQNKLRRILDQLDLQPGEHLLEIGTGWGALAIMAARDYGCQVTTTTLSEAQYVYARDCIEKAGLTERITLLRQDYRQLEGRYDKIVSVEMVEAVGKGYLAGFFRQCDALLKPGGKLALQSITIADQRLDAYAQNPDFIQKHVFPGGFLPSVSLLTKHFDQHTSMVMRDLFDFGGDYARTLQDWRQLLLKNTRTLANHGYDQRFMRLWLYYFGYCEAGFLSKNISVIQLTAEKAP